MLSPVDEIELAEIVAGASTPLAIHGGGTRPIGRNVDGEPITTARISGITLYEPGSLTVSARAGTSLAEINAALEAEGQMLAFEPMDHRRLLGTEGTPTIGGIVAANVSGPRRVQAGACRDYLLGIRFVDGVGTVIKNGGRVMKNVTGYDLTKLMAGSRGTLGILSEVSFKVLPKPETIAALHLAGLSVSSAVAAMSLALKSPFEVSGAAHVPVGPDGHPVTMLRVEGFETSVVYRSEKLRDLLAPFGAADIECRLGNDGSYGTKSGWQWVRDAEIFANTSDDVWRISVKPSDAPRLVEHLGDARLLLDWGGGLIWAGIASGTDMRATMKGIGGHATLIRASEETKARVRVFPREDKTLAALSEGLRQKFDPKAILNPGLMN